MEIRLLSEISGKEKVSKASLFSYFLVYDDPDGNRELLPADNHAAAYPLVVSLHDHSIIRGKVNFFNRPVFNGFSALPLIDDVDLEYLYAVRKHSRCLVINILDNCYGHSLLKMFNLVLFFEKYNTTFDFFVISPIALKPFLPLDKVSACLVKKTFNDLEKGYKLDSVLQQITAAYSGFDIAFLNTYQQYSNKNIIIDFFHFFDSLKSITTKPSVIFYYRKDKKRKWGMFTQRKKIIAYFSSLRPFFSDIVDFIIIGEKDHVSFPAPLLDYRCNSYSEAVEFQYNELMRQSLFVTGIHGSHLILPSLLSRQTFHILPSFKRKNTAEDMVNVSQNIIQASLAHFQIANDSLKFTISAKKVALVSLVVFMASLEKEYKINLSACKSNNALMGQEEYINTVYPFFNYLKACAYWNKKEASMLRFFSLLRNFS